MILESKNGVAGVFHKIQVLRADGTVKTELGSFNNLITDLGLQRLSQENAFDIMKVSTDNSEPKITDVTLDGYIASVSGGGQTGSRGINLEEGYVWGRYTWSFPIGAINNQNISKLATGWSQNNSDNFSIALIKDAQGNPTSITVLSTEQLRVTWEFRVYWDPEDTTGIIENSGNKGGSYEYICRPSQINDWRTGRSDYNGLQPRKSINPSWNINAIDNPSGNGYRGFSLYKAPVELGGIHSWPISTGNTAGAANGSSSSAGSLVNGSSMKYSYNTGNANALIGGFSIVGAYHSGYADNPFFRFQVKIDPPIEKTSFDTLSISVAFRWERKIIEEEP